MLRRAGGRPRGAGSRPTLWPYYQIPQKGTNEWLAAQWKEHLGIEVKPQLVPVAAIAELRRRAETSPRLVNLGWCADYPDQQNWLSTVFHSTSKVQPETCDAAAARCRPWYASRAFDRLVEQADALSDQAKRDDLYRQASRLLSAEAPPVWLTYRTDFILTKTWVRGLNTNAIDTGGFFRPEDVYVVKRRP